MVETLDDFVKKEYKVETSQDKIGQNAKLVLYGIVIVGTLMAGYYFIKNSGYEPCKKEEIKQNIEMMYK